MKLNDEDIKKKYMAIVRANKDGNLYLKHKATKDVFAAQLSSDSSALNMYLPISVSAEHEKHILRSCIPIYWSVWGYYTPIGYIRERDVAFLKESVRVLDAMDSYDVINEESAVFPTTYTYAHAEKKKSLVSFWDDKNTYFVYIDEMANDIRMLTIPAIVDAKLIFESLDSLCEKVLLLDDLNGGRDFDHIVQTEKLTFEDIEIVLNVRGIRSLAKYSQGKKRLKWATSIFYGDRKWRKISYTILYRNKLKEEDIV